MTGRSLGVQVLLADEFYFLAHDDTTGRLRLNPKVAGFGMAAALVGELVFLGRVTVRDGQLRVVDPRPPSDPLAHATLDHLLRERAQRSVAVWLAFLAKNAADAVTQRLWRAGLLQAEPRGLLRRQVRYLPVDMNVAAATQAAISTRLRQLHPLRESHGFLAGLMVATGLDRGLLGGAPRSTFDFLRQQLDQLPPPLRELLLETQSAVGAAVLSHRT